MNEEKIEYMIADIMEHTAFDYLGSDDFEGVEDYIRDIIKGYLC